MGIYSIKRVLYMFTYSYKLMNLFLYTGMMRVSGVYIYIVYSCMIVINNCILNFLNDVIASVHDQHHVTTKFIAGIQLLTTYIQM